MQIKSVSPRHFPIEQEYNFKVKVNYNNGAISLHGPATHIQAPTPQMSVPQYPINYVQPFAPSHPIPVFRQNVPLNQNYLRYSPSFSASTASHSQFPENQGMKNFKTNFDSITETSSIQNPPTQRQRASQPLFKTEVENERKIIINCKQQQQIDCVICQKKFKAKDFDYHLELHRNPRRKTEEIPASNYSLNDKDEKPVHNSSYQSIKPELLYSFHNQSNAQGSFVQQQSFRSQRNSKVIENNQPILNSSHNSSVVFDNKSRNSSMIRNQNNVGQIQSGIRYLAPQTANAQVLNNSIMSGDSKGGRISLKHQPIVTSGPASGPIIYGSNHSQSVSSVRSSQVFTPQLINNIDPRISQSSSRTLKQSQQQVAQYQIIPNPSQQSQHSKQQSVNPFELIQQEQSKIYQYFPNSGHYTLSQHRVNSVPIPNNNASYQFPETEQDRVKSPHIQGGLQRSNNQLNFMKNLRNTINNEEQENCSRISHSSISSIRSLTQPLEDMSKDKIIRTYHNPKNKIDLSNIIGMSEVLARQGVTNNSNSVIKQHQSIYNNNTNNRSSYNQFKVITAKSMILSPESQHNYQPNPISKDPKYAQMEGIQNRQIYRGTQVEEDDLRGFDAMNITRSSKSSTKTKIPRNYLAVNDFINSGSTQRKPH